MAQGQARSIETKWQGDTYIIFLALSNWILGGRMEGGLQAARNSGGCYDDSRSVQAGCSVPGFGDRIDIGWFRRIVYARRQRTVRDGQMPGEAYPCKAGAPSESSVGASPVDLLSLQRRRLAVP